MKELKFNDKGNLNILVTGGCGYLGSQLIRNLAVGTSIGGLKIRVLDNLQSAQYQGLMNLPDSGIYEFIEGDILNPNIIELALRDVDVVIHLAAIVRTSMSFDNPAWVEQVNHWGTAHLVEACLESGVQRLIFASSTAVYGPGGPFTENDPCHPIGPYAQSKFRAEKSIHAAIKRGLKPTILRFGTIYGYAPVTRFDAVANRFAYLAGVGRSLTVYGTGDQQRPVIHVQDVCQSIQFCLNNFDVSVNQVFNAVSENITILDLVKTIQKIKPDIKAHFTEQDILTHLSFEINSEKIRNLGWSPSISIALGLEELLKKFSNLSRVTTSHKVNLSEL